MALQPQMGLQRSFLTTACVDAFLPEVPQNHRAV